MTLAVRDALLPMAAIRQRMDNVREIPFIVGFVLEEFDPHIRNGHGEPIIKANPAFVYRRAKQGHARDVFSNRDNFGEQGMHSIIRLSKVSSERHLKKVREHTSMR